MSNEELKEIILQTSKGELIDLLHEISTSELNELDNAVHLIKVIFNLMD